MHTDSPLSGAKASPREHKTVYTRSTCRLCTSKDLTVVIPLQSTPIADAYIPKASLGKTQTLYSLDVMLCGQCGHLQLRDVVDPQLLYGEYLYTTSTSLGLVKHFEDYANDVLSYVRPKRNSLIVEIGSNEGALLRAFKKREMRVLGVDPALSVACRATEAGLETLPALFTAKFGAHIRDERGPASIIAANNVFANIDDVDDFIAGVHTLLAPDGVFIFETGYLADLIESAVFDNIYHEHVSYFAISPLRQFFLKHGLELIHVEHVKTKGGSIRGIVQLVGGARKVSQKITTFLDREISLSLDHPEGYRSFVDRIRVAKEKMHDALSPYLKKGKTVAGFGASHSVTTFLYEYGIGSSIKFLVDDNPVKHELFSPGLHIPVHSTEALFTQKPDIVVILPWRFADSIIKKHHRYLEMGGEFIVPLPSLEVVRGDTYSKYVNSQECLLGNSQAEQKPFLKASGD